MGRRGGGHGGFLFPQAETELSGLCDDDNGGRIPRGSGPLAGTSHPVANLRRPARTLRRAHYLAGNLADSRIQWDAPPTSPGGSRFSRKELM